MNSRFNIISSKPNIFKESKFPILSTVKQVTRNIVQQYLSSEQLDLLHRAVNVCKMLLNKQGVHSTIVMNSAGFKYTNNGDTARCDTCGLEVSGWTLDMKPFTIHSQRSPTCPFVLLCLPTE